jgi:phosphotriesterase-related protein
MPIHTVLGPIEPDQLGPTSMHEHLLIDATVWSTPPTAEPMPDDARVTIENLGFLRWNLLSLEDNLRMDDPEIAVRELVRVRDSGGSGIVDLTVIGLGRRISELPRIAQRSGLHIMVGCGIYVGDAHPPWVRDMSVDALTELLIGELRDGIDDTGVRPALIGEIGTGDPITDDERRVVVAAGAAGAQTGAAVNVHIDPRGEHALEVVDLLMREGMDPGRIVLSHMDEHLDAAYHLAVAETGAVIEYDTFGSEFYFGDNWKDPTDLERFEYVDLLLEHGCSGRLVFGCDVWVKAQLRTFGGTGYEHLMRRVRPALLRRGVPEDVLEQILVATPRRLLDRPLHDGAA